MMLFISDPIFEHIYKTIHQPQQYKHYFDNLRDIGPCIVSNRNDYYDSNIGKIGHLTINKSIN